MAQTRATSKPPLGCLVGVILAVLGAGMLVLAGAAAGGWYLYSRHRAATSPSSTPPAMDVATAVATLRGRATPAEQARALKSLELHAERGNAKAMVITAACYRAGLGTPRDDQFKAFEWHRKAAAAGEPAAMAEMARYYAEGVWVEPNPQKSREWLERAAAAGDVGAKWALGRGGK